MRNAASRVRQLTVGALAAGAVVVGTGIAMAGPAAAQPSAGAGEKDATAQRTVTMRDDIKELPLRNEPHQDSGPGRYPSLLNGATVPALCWSEGQHVNAWGVAHNKWVRVRIDAPGYPGYYDQWVWGGGLKGSETGNVPNHC